MRGRFVYGAYGLTFRSQVPLPELPPASNSAEIEIAIADVCESPHHGDAKEIAVSVTSNTIRLSHSAVGGFKVSDGRTITIEPAPGVDASLIRFHLLGPALGALLRQRGHLVLHASAVHRDGAALLFAGVSGAGKSTIAAALCTGGYSPLADDIAAVDATGPHPMVLSGFAQFKLDARAATAAELPNTGGIISALEKRYYPAQSGFAHRPVPLKRVYVLTDSIGLNSIDDLNPQEALVELLRHSYGARSLQVVNRESHFKQCATVASRVPLRRLSRKMELAGLPALMRLIENDLVKTT